MRLLISEWNDESKWEVDDNLSVAEGGGLTRYDAKRDEGKNNLIKSKSCGVCTAADVLEGMFGLEYVCDFHYSDRN